MENIEPPSVRSCALRWGIHHQHKVSFGTSTVYSCFPINKNEYIALTSTKLVRFEQNIIKETSNLNFSAATYIKPNNIIVGVSTINTELIFVRPYDLSHPIYTNVRTKQVPTFHIMYSPITSNLITSGKGVKIWKLDCVLPSRNIISIPPVINITLRAELDALFDSDMINEPIFDFVNELLILPQMNGFNAYNMDGKMVRQMSRISNPYRVSATYGSVSKTFITIDPSEGVCEWGNSCSLLKRSTIGNTSVISCRLLNDSFLLYLDAKNCLYLYDTRSLRLFNTIQLEEKPTSMIVMCDDDETSRDSGKGNFRIAVCIKTEIDVFKVVIPWRLWLASMPRPHSLRWCPRLNKAARVLVHTDNEYVYFISPKTVLPVTSASPSSSARLKSAYYDRGLLISEGEPLRDQLFMVLLDGKLVISATASIPCEEITTIEARAASVFECFYARESNNNNNNNNERATKSMKLHYCVATTTGEVIIYDYDTFQPVKRYIVNVGLLVYACYDFRNNTVVMFYDYEIVRFDITNGKIVHRLRLQQGSIYDSKDQLCLVGYKSGKIAMVAIEEKDNEMKFLSNEDSVSHSNEITGFAFGNNFFISVSSDQQMKFWSFSGANIATLFLPLPLYSVAVLNGKRDIIVGTDKEIMIINGETIFSSEFEAKDDILDNFNEKFDELSDDGISPLKFQEDQKQAYLIARKEKEEKEEDNSKNNRPVNYVYKKTEIDEKTRKRIYEQMLKMSDDGFTSARIAEREKKRFADQKVKIQEEHDKKMAVINAEREAKEKIENEIKEKEKEIKRQKKIEEEEMEKKMKEERLRIEEEEELLKRQKEEELKKKLEEEEEERRQKEKAEEEEKKKLRKEEEEEEKNEDNENNDLFDYENKNKPQKVQSFNGNKGNSITNPSQQTYKPTPPKESPPPKRKKSRKKPHVKAGIINLGFDSNNNNNKVKTRQSDINNKNNNNNNEEIGVVWVSEDGKKYRMLANGDWIDENGKVFHHRSDGAFVADDGTIWGGPDSSGHFETTNGKPIESNNFDKDSDTWISPDGKIYKNLGDGRWISADGEVYTLTTDGRLVTEDGKEIMTGDPTSEEDGTSANAKKKWVGPDGKEYILQKDGRYVAEDGSIWDKPLDGSAGGYFESPDGSKPGDTFIDENGNVFCRTNDGWIDQKSGKVYKISKDGTFVAEDGSVFDCTKKGKFIRQDSYNPNDTYIAPDGTVYKRTPSNRGWIGADGKRYYMNKDGVFVADDGSVLPLSKEKICWIGNDGTIFRPTGINNEWIAYSVESNDDNNNNSTNINDDNDYHNNNNNNNDNNNNNNNNNNKSVAKTKKYRFDGEKFVADDGSTWIGPTSTQGKFAGQNVSNTPIQWIDYDGVVYKPISNDGSRWINSLGQTFIRQSNGEYIEVEEEGAGEDKHGNEHGHKNGKENENNGNAPTAKKKKVWGGPGKGGGRWINNKGHIIDTLGGYWAGPDNKVYTATKGGYISSDAILFKPSNAIDSFVANGGMRWNGLGQPNGKWVEANGNEYTPLDTTTGLWEGPNGEVFSPQPNGKWVGKSSGIIWSGPPFLSARKYFIGSNQYSRNIGMSSTLGGYEVMIGKPRSSTPLYRIPNLLYPPFKSRFKAFRPKTPPPKKLRVIYTMPPPNIVVDPSQVARLVMMGHSQLLPLAKRLGIETSGKNTTDNFLNGASCSSSSPPEALQPRLNSQQQIPLRFGSGHISPRNFAATTSNYANPNPNSNSSENHNTARISKRMKSPPTNSSTRGNRPNPLPLPKIPALPSINENNNNDNRNDDDNNCNNDNDSEKDFDETMNQNDSENRAKLDTKEVGFKFNFTQNDIIGENLRRQKLIDPVFQWKDGQPQQRLPPQPPQIGEFGKTALPIPLLSFAAKEPLSARLPRRVGAYSPGGSYYTRDRERKAKDTMQLNNPLIVRNMCKPKITIPQSLTRSKRNL